MANRYWIAGTAQNWNDTTYWSTSSGGGGGASVPGASDVANFDGNGVGDCRLNASLAGCGFVVTNGYTGTIDGGTDNLDHAVDIFTFNDGGSPTFDPGTGLWTISGNVDGDNTESISMIGAWSVSVAASINWDADGNDNLRPTGLHVAAGVTLTILSVLYGRADDQNFNIEGTVSGGLLHLRSGNGQTGSLTIASGGLCTGGTVSVGVGSSSTQDLTVVIDGECASALNIDGKNGSAYSLGGTGEISGDLMIDASGGPGACTFTAAASLPTISGSYLLRSSHAASALNAQCDTNNPDFVFQGDVTIDTGGAGVNYTKGTGTITFSGTADQAIDFAGEAVEDIVLDKSAGSVSQTGNVDPDSFTGDDGTWDVNGNNLTTVANFDAAAGTVFNDTAGGGLVTVGGNFALAGVLGNLVTWNGPALDVTGTATADYATVTGSDATAGTEVTATNSTDNGGNSGWNFGAAGATRLLALRRKTVLAC